MLHLTKTTMAIEGFNQGHNTFREKRPFAKLLNVELPQRSGVMFKTDKTRYLDKHFKCILSLF